NSHSSIDISYLGTLKMERYEHISPHGDQPGPPDEKFQEIHYNETKLYTHSGKIIKYPTFRTFTPRLKQGIMSTITQVEAILKTTSRELEQIGEKILAEQRITPEEGLLLFEKGTLSYLGALAN